MKIAKAGLFLVLALGFTTAAAQTPSAPAGDLNTLLLQLDQVADTTNLDLAKLRIEKWKGDGDSKRQLQANADSLSRNISGALPTLTSAVRTSPESLSANFKLYRNLDALYDVLSTLAETAAHAAPKNDYQTLATDVSNLDALRRALADRVEALTGAKEAELARLRAGGTSAAKSSSGVKKIVIDDSAPTRSTRKKKSPPPK